MELLRRHRSFPLDPVSVNVLVAVNLLDVLLVYLLVICLFMSH